MTRHTPVHVTMRLRPGLATLRSRRGYRVFVQAAVRARERLGMRVVAWSLQSDHVHMVVEAEDTPALAAAMKGLGVRFARAFNRAHHRRGAVLADRYHARPLPDPIQARNALRYVLANARHHVGPAPRRGAVWLDAFSSAPWFGGWRDGRVLVDAMRRAAQQVLLELGATGPPVAVPTSWMLRIGWRARGGPLSVTEAPAS